MLLTLVPAAFAIAVAQAQSHDTAQSASRPAGELTGSPDAGKTIFEGAGKCLTCHRAGASGSVVGPNLSNVGAQLSPGELKQSLLNPATTIAPKDRLYQIVTSAGKTVKGKLLNQGPVSLQMLDSDGQLVAFMRSQVRDGHFVDPPQMPSYQDKLTGSQIDDLVAYLASLRTPGNQ